MNEVPTCWKPVHLTKALFNEEVKGGTCCPLTFFGARA
jgi:hypothetical protein